MSALDPETANLLGRLETHMENQKEQSDREYTEQREFRNQFWKQVKVLQEKDEEINRLTQLVKQQEEEINKLQEQLNAHKQEKKPNDNVSDNAQ